MTLPVKSTASAILHLYPNLVPTIDFNVLEQNGVQTINVWNNPNTQPTQDQIDSAWFEVCKQFKKDELNTKCNEAIIGGFASNALGVSHTYPSDEEAQRNFNSEINRYSVDPNYSSSNIKTLDSGYLSHTKTQFYQVFMDGHDFVTGKLTHLNTLKAQVDALTYPTNTETDIDAVTW